MYIWFKKSTDLEELKEQGLKFPTSMENGLRYLNIFGSESTPIPDIPEEMIECVTLRERIYGGLRVEGVYRHGEAKLVIQSVFVSDGSSSGSTYWYQDINVTGPTVESVREIYSLVRQGRLSPTEDWEATPRFLSKLRLSSFPQKLRKLILRQRK